MFNPVMRPLALFVFTTPLLISIDRISAGVACILVIPLIVILGFGPRKWIRHAWPVLLAAILAGVSMTLYGRPEGHVYASFLSARITDNSIYLGEAIILRVLAIGLASVALLRDIDPTYLGDGLAQKLHLPWRFVLATVAGLRLISLFRQDWQALSLARRARGLGDHNRIRRGAGQAFSLLVFALRRASSLATAMEARGFGASPDRTWARQSIITWKDWTLIGVCLGIATTAIALSVWAGEFRFLGVA
ncbi:energy-coupling factor transporter transmembrane protein EcfT [Corynebacterium poyangense]|uniref:Energy-coupling factor transporter transmembrane protein EcfT n=1 Tax=Corynebacterium poyangense TaxID=2684405 RepID=A0A7H0SS18_9CORY|nr:energy-coupling factor transporter transmembrane component T [Corynebacterium poyangense]QNQ91343.1 energy-coupling factor transporter transmembrane protein EcfT [Corynebacterium poyangense]